MRRLADRWRRHLATDVWSVSLDELGRGRRALYRTGRVLHSTAVAYRAKHVSFWAAALTYFSVLSIVPFLAFAFSVLKGLGGYRRLVGGTLLPYVHHTFSGNPALLRAIDQVFDFVQRTDVARLGALGVLFLAYSAIKLLSTIEIVLNDIWGAKGKRSPIRQLTDYTTMLVIGPLFIFVAATLATAAQSSEVVRFLKDTLSLGPVIDFLLRLSSVVLACAAMIALFMIIPNVRVKPASAILGGTVAGLLWQGVLMLHVRFQAGVASYNALYSGFAAIPIFLVWLYVSWLVVQIGALIGASHQYEKSVHQSLRAARVDQDLREELVIAVAGRVTRGVLDAPSRVTAAGLAEELAVPLPAVEEALEAMTRAGLAAPAALDSDVAYLPAVDIDTATLDRVLAAVRHDPSAEGMREALRARTGPAVADLLRRIDGEMRACGHDVTLRQLGQMADGGAEARAAVAPHSDEPGAPGGPSGGDLTGDGRRA